MTTAVTIEAGSDVNGGWLTVPVSGTYHWTMAEVRPLDFRSDTCIGRVFLLSSDRPKQPIQGIEGSTVTQIQGTTTIETGRWHGDLVTPVLFGKATLDPKCAWHLTLTLTSTS